MNAEEIKKELTGKLEELKSNPDNIEILINIVELNMKLGVNRDAINYCNRVLEIDETHRVAKNYREQIQLNLRFTNKESYETTNMDCDPWLD